MINLIGFWFVATVLVALMLVPVFGIAYLIVQQAARSAMPSDAASKLTDLLIKAAEVDKMCTVYYYRDNLSTEWIECDHTKYLHDLGYGKAYVKKERAVRPTDALRVCGVITTTKRWLNSSFAVGSSVLVLTAIISWSNGVPLSVPIARVATALGSVGGYAALVVGAYFGLVMLLRYAYKASVWLAKVSAHVDKAEDTRK